MPTLPPEALQLLTVKGFDQAFTRLLNNPKLPTQQKAYDVLEEKYIEYFGRRRYSGFDSYRKVRNRRLSRK